MDGMRGRSVGAGHPDPSLTRFPMSKNLLGFVYIKLVLRWPVLTTKGRRAAKAINYFSAICCTSVATPSCRTFLRARGVFIFVRNFSRGIFLGESLSKVVKVLTACASVSQCDIKGAS